MCLDSIIDFASDAFSDAGDWVQSLVAESPTLDAGTATQFAGDAGSWVDSFDSLGVPYAADAGSWVDGFDSLGSGLGAGSWSDSFDSLGVDLGGSNTAGAITDSVASGANIAAAPVTTAGLSTSMDSAPVAGGGYDTSYADLNPNDTGTVGIKTLQAAQPSLLDQAKDTLKGVNWGQAGLKLGAQALGSLATGAGTGKLTSYLDDIKGLEQQTQQFNMNQANKKAGIGDQLVTNAAGMDPSYTAQQSMTRSKNLSASQWGDTEAALRAHGYDDNYINAMKQKSDLNASQSAGTAYDSGYQSGVNSQNSTYATAGQMYTGVSQPTAGLVSGYQAASNSDANAQKGWGNAIEQAFGVVDDSTKKSTKTS